MFGSEQNPNFTRKKWSEILKNRLGKGTRPALDAFKHKDEGYVIVDTATQLAAGMCRLATRFQEKARNFLSMVQLFAIKCWMN